MHPDHREALERRVVQAAEGALAHHQYVSAIDVLTGMGLLALTNLDPVRAGGTSDAGPELKPIQGLLSSDWRADFGPNDFTGDNQLHAAILLPACGGIV